MTDVVRGLVDDDPNDEETWIGTAEVTDAAAGQTTDGRLLIAVQWRGATTQCAYLDSYTPSVGDYVTFLKSGSSALVLGRPATAP